MLAIVPLVVFYVICQKYIIEGVMAGAVKVKLIEKALEKIISPASFSMQKVSTRWSDKGRLYIEINLR